MSFCLSFFLPFSDVDLLPSKKDTQMPVGDMASHGVEGANQLITYGKINVNSEDSQSMDFSPLAVGNVLNESIYSTKKRWKRGLKQFLNTLL